MTTEHTAESRQPVGPPATAEDFARRALAKVKRYDLEYTNDYSEYREPVDCDDGDLVYFDDVFAALVNFANGLPGADEQ
jgi:hypothetical protein